MELHFTVNNADEINLVTAKTTISDFCDRTIDCKECPFWKDFGNGYDECMIQNFMPYYWRDKYGKVAAK